MALALCGSLGLAACSDEPSDDAKVEEAVGVTVEAPKIKVLEQGAQPGRVLRYEDSDAEQSVNIAIASGFGQQASDQAQVQAEAPSSVDTTSLKAEADAQVREDDGSRSISLRLHNPRIDDLELGQDVASSDGFQAGWFADASGKITSVNFAAPVDATDRGRGITEEYLRTLVANQVVFPDEALGVGGKWSVESLVSLGTNMLQTTTYTIRALDDHSVDLDATIERRPAEGAIDDGNVQLKVLSSRTTSTATLRIDLREPLPQSGELSAVTRVVYGQDDSPARVLQDFGAAVRYSQ
ncbi:hypothetical protein [Corynebacterium pelargi]|uniref:Uncharacterized protein n=1 Tax=Corynebacterium pelargi TaxID=1471400 RepID=A0A410W7X3_9CORY|nr:hypothetical protein [Corynebacterium pelargi]QAU52052.1 hypothetical protein CPELA_03865 [Corynebacterium pelargi]GGG70480.1 hypothetical protein GCM10007338_04250 [Corynebacterium pelargi]